MIQFCIFLCIFVWIVGFCVVYLWNLAIFDVICYGIHWLTCAMLDSTGWSPARGLLLNPALAEFLTITIRSCEFCVRSRKHSNIAYNVYASGIHYQYAVAVHFRFTIAYALCKGSRSYDIRYLSMSSGSVEEHSSNILSVIAPYFRPVISQIWLLLLVGFRIFFLFF